MIRAGTGAGGQRGVVRVLRDIARIYWPAGVLLLLGLALAWHFLPPPPPMRLVMATSGPEEPYQAFGLRYRDELAREGIALELRQTAGAVENLRLLEDADSGVDIAFTQGGIAPVAGGEKIRAIASVFLEPLWLFSRRPITPESIESLRGLRVAIGPEGSGTREMVEELLAANGMSPADLTLVPLADHAAAEALRADRVDVVAVVTPAADPVLGDLAALPDLHLLNLVNARGYGQRFRYLREVTLYRGVLDFGRGVPDHDITMIAPVAALVARADLHPALVDALAAAALEIHSPGDLFAEPRAFPVATHPQIPTIRGARAYLEHGPSFLQRWLPIWAASLVERSVIVLIPLLTVLLPLGRALPRLIDWRIRSRAYRWYRELRAIEREAGQLTPGDAAQRTALLRRLDEVDRRVLNISMPLSRSDLLYNLRQHLDLVRARLAGLQATGNRPDGESGGG